MNGICGSAMDDWGEVNNHMEVSQLTEQMEKERSSSSLVLGLAGFTLHY